MLQRKATQKLLEWKNNNHHKALCIFGARQIGKTTIIREFARENYEHVVELNFVTDPKAADIFSGSLNADDIITALTAYTQTSMEPGKTLVFFDEIQECPNARTSIKFLVEDGRFDYIESGLLLGARYKEVRSYPVGFEEIFQMYPMDFEEFLWANRVPLETISYLKKCFTDCSEVLPSVHDTMCKLFFSYIVIGGMPAVVQTYVNTHDIGKVVELQKSLLEQYRQDISRYASGADKIKIKAIFDSIPAQLNDKNRRFYLNALNPTARINRYENSFKWLEDAGVAMPVYNVTEPQMPLKLNSKHSLFKLFMNDVGLLCASCMENIQFDLLKGNMDIHLGSILENAIAQQLQSNGYELFYFDSVRHGEVDFVVSAGTTVSLVEVKSGKDYKQHRALDHMMEVDEWSFSRCDVLCKGNVKQHGNVTYLPWYMVMFMCQKKIPQGYIYEVDISALQN